MEHADLTPVRWGIIGCSRVAQHRWIPAIKEAGGQIVAIASRTRSYARKWARDFDLGKAYGDYDALLADAKVDAVYIGLPNNFHHPWTILTLNAGKHVLCDKPLGMHLGEVEQMVQVAEQRERLLFEPYIYQYHDLYEKIDTWIEQGKIGQLKKFHITFAFYLNQPGNIRFKPELGGGVLKDLGCYCVHMMRKLAGQCPRSVRAYQVPHSSGVDLTTVANLYFPDDLVGLFDCSFGYQADQKLQIAGVQGHIDCDNPISSEDEVRLTLTTPDDNQNIQFPYVNRYLRCVQNFHGMLAQGWSEPSPARDSIANTKVMDAIAEAAKTGREISLV